jgi:hypothetical protein
MATPATALATMNGTTAPNPSEISTTMTASRKPAMSAR